MTMSKLSTEDLTYIRDILQDRLTAIRAAAPEGTSGTTAVDHSTESRLRS